MGSVIIVLARVCVGWYMRGVFDRSIEYSNIDSALDRIRMSLMRKRTAFDTRLLIAIQFDHDALKVDYRGSTWLHV